MMDSDTTRSDRDSQGSALMRMASRHRVAAARAQAEFASALRMAFGRMASECPGLDGVVQTVDIRPLGLAELEDLVESGMFLALLEGQGEQMGLLMACPAVMASLIEAQTTGQVSDAPAPRRRPTRTDAALLAPMIDAFLRLLEERCAELPEAAMVRGHAYGSFLDDPRPLGVMLEEGPYLLMHLKVALGYGARQGDWMVLLPTGTKQAAARAGTDAEAEERDWAACLTAAVSVSPVRIEAVLCRMQLSLTDALRLRPGDVLRLPENALEALALESIAHEAVGIGRLGQARGNRAVRLTADPGVLTDSVGVSLSPVALPASIMPFRPPQAAFMPDGGAADGADAGSSDDAPDTVHADESGAGSSEDPTPEGPDKPQ
ncbi:MAG: FliM/FliN family flagellar motor switch protein [Rhodobacteraceae bacterium]|nr:FliM/FliN family flagellar motor switch protein [Paracoccaceae bacterium]